ncbi:hypothetical protein SFRURICE_011645, partial [Spodoptera frugiperda]
VTSLNPEGVGREKPKRPLRIKKRVLLGSNTSPDPEIEPETSCPAVALATIRPTRQLIMNCANNNRCPTLAMSPETRVPLQTHKFTYTLHMTPRPETIIAPCGDRTRYTLRVSQLPSHHANRAV